MRALLALSLLLAASSPGLAAWQGVNDAAGFFKPETVERATELIRRIRDEFGFDVHVETMKTIPKFDKKNWDAKDRNQRLEQCLRVAKDRADELGVRPVLYVMIVTELENVTVIGWPDDFNASSAGFASAVKRNLLRQTLERDLRRKSRRDRALITALEVYKRSLTHPQEPAPLETVPALILVASLLGGWAVLSLVRRQRAAPDKPLPIYQPAMLGSLFGVPASYWVNDRLFQSERPLPLPPVSNVLAAEEAPHPGEPPSGAPESHDAGHLADAPLEPPHQGEHP